MKNSACFVVGFVSLALLFTAGCGGSGGSASPGGSGGDLREVQRELRDFAREHDLHQTEALEAHSQEVLATAQEWNKLKRSKPELKSYYEASDAAQSRMVKAKVDGDDAAFEEAKSEFAKVRMDLESKANQMPDVQELAAKLREFGDKEMELLADAAAEVNAEGKKLAERYRKLAE